MHKIDPKLWRGHDRGQREDRFVWVASYDVIFFLISVQYLHSSNINCAISDFLEGRSLSYLLDLYLLVYLLLYILNHVNNIWFIS